MVWCSNLNTFPDVEAIFTLHPLHSITGHGRVVPDSAAYQLDW